MKKWKKLALTAMLVGTACAMCGCEQLASDVSSDVKSLSQEWEGTEAQAKETDTVADSSVTGITVADASDSESDVSENWSNLDRLWNTKIVIEDIHDSFTIGEKMLKKLVTVDQEADTFAVDEAAVRSFVEDEMYPAFNSVGAERVINSPVSGEVTVTGGTLGNDIDIEAEIQELISDIERGGYTTREPCYDKHFEQGTTNGGVGDSYVEVDITKQKAYWIKDGMLQYAVDCITGLPNGTRDTDTGCFYIAWKATDYTMTDFDCTVAYWMPFNDSTGQGLHDATWQSSFGGDAYYYRGSHGCVNLSLESAEYFYENCPTHTPVVIHEDSDGSEEESTDEESTEGESTEEDTTTEDTTEY